MAKLMTVAEHTAIYGTMAASIVAEPEPVVEPGLDPRVQRGVDYLDEHYPGWADKINLDEFDLECGIHCVVGQVFGEYEENVYKAFDIDRDDGDFPSTTTADEESYGVCFGDETTNDDPDVWSRCEDDWRIAIEARQKEPA
jgi:hypothetical protein